MRILLVAVVCGIRSVGRICTDLAQALEEQGHEVKIAYGRETLPEQFEKYAVRTTTDWEIRRTALETRLLDNAGLTNTASTRQLIETVKTFDPDIINLHVLHGYWLNVELLFRHLRTCGKRIVWTFHDCWAFTGHCAYFDYAGCDRWKTGCHDCPEKKTYPASLFLDRSNRNYRWKKERFTGIPNMQIVTPSAWLADYVKDSFLREYPVQVIHNGIDTAVFRRNERTLAVARQLAERYDLRDKKVAVAVSTSWDRRKGLPEYSKLADALGEDYKVVVIGLTPKLMKTLPANVLGIQRTDSPEELAGFYVLAHAYVNASLEENYPTTNLEAISCGTPVITYDTGGSGESAVLYGTVVPKGDVPALAEAVRRADTLLPAAPDSYDLSRRAMTDRYIELFLKGNGT